MKLEWMGEQRALIESIIRFSNRYAATYRKPYTITEDIALSNMEIQVVEYLLENEELELNMADTARRLGISASVFTKYVGKLEGMGLLDKYHRNNNKKDVIVLVSDKGRTVYNKYVEKFTDWARVLNEMLDDIPQKHIRKYAEAFDYISELNRGQEEQRKGKDGLIPI